jgi:hypothetical protein
MGALLQDRLADRPSIVTWLWLSVGSPGVEYLHRSPASRRRRRRGKSRIWDSKIRSRVPRHWDPKMTALAKASSNCKRQIRPLVRDGTPHQETRNCMTEIKIWSWAPDGCLTPRETGRLTVGRNTSLTLTWVGSQLVHLGRCSWKVPGSEEQEPLDTEAKDATQLEAVTKQRSEDRDWERKCVCYSAP